jgi:hypothetical protein
MNTTDNAKLAYDTKKKDRGERQRRDLDVIFTLPENEQAVAIFKRWPQDLPLKLIKYIPNPLLDAWMSMHEEREDARDPFTPERLREMARAFRWEEMAQETNRAYGDEINHIIAVMRSISGAKELTVMMPDTLDGETKNEDDDESGMTGIFMVNENGKIDDEDSLRGGLGIALKEGGSMIIRQQLKLKVQRVDLEGNMEWKNQERVYGMFLNEGQMIPLDDKELKQSYSVDHQTGKAIETPLGLHYGNLKDFMKPKTSAAKLH